MPLGALRPKDAANVSFIDVRLVAVSGTAFTNVARLPNNRALADEYTAVVSGVTGTTTKTGTVTIATASGKGPYNGRVVSGVVFDGTVQNDIVPGLAITKTSSSGVANGNTTTFKVGIWTGVNLAGNPTGVQLDWSDGIDDPGPVSVAAGDPHLIARVRFYNTDTDAQVGCRALVLPRVIPVSTAGPEGFTEIYPVNLTPAERNIGGRVEPLKFRFSALNTAANPDTITVEYSADGGSTWDVFDVRDTTNPPLGTIPSTDLNRNGTTLYQIVEASLNISDLMFIIDAGADNTSTENVLIYDPRYVRVAPDVAGSPGTWSDTEAYITQSGEAAGVVNSGQSGYVWVEYDTDSAASNKQSPFPADIFVISGASGETNWTG